MKSLEPALSNELANLLARLFIQRTDARAIARFDANGEAMYMPELEYKDGPRKKWDRAALLDHLNGDKVYGHYLLDANDDCKLLAFDVDLKQSGTVFVDDSTDKRLEVADLRAYWRDRANLGRRYLKLSMNLVAQALVDQLDSLEIPWAVAYSGNKGIHVYGFTGKMNAALIREAAKIAMDGLTDWKPSKGDNFYTFQAEEDWMLFNNFTIEVFPKQDSLAGKDLGNLMRLPLGKNLKSKDHPFFMDITGDPYQLTPTDAIATLTAVAERMG